MSEFNQRLLIVAGFILFLALIVELSPAQAHDTIGIAALCELADKHGNGVPPSLVVALIEEESGGQPDIVSSAGAVGLMQIIQRFHPGVDLTDPATNIDVGTHVLITDWLYLNHIRSGLQTAAEIDWSNSDWLGRSLRGYNMGPGNVVWYDQHPDKQTPEAVTRYADNIESLFGRDYCAA